MRKLPLFVIVAAALSVSACASFSEKGVGSKADSSKAWWKASNYSRKADFKAWHYGDVRPGKGLLSDDEDGITIYKGGSRSGSSDSSKPTKVRR